MIILNQGWNKKNNEKNRSIMNKKCWLSDNLRKGF